VVLVTDAENRPVQGVEVAWEADGGAVSPEVARTGPDGRAATQRVLGDQPGSYETMASADLEGSPIAFTATGLAPPSPQLVLVTQPSADASAGVPFTRQPALQLQDAVGAPLARADVAVTVQIADGGGSLGGSTTARSNAEGVVTFTDLSIRGQPGERTLIFAASDFTSAISEEIDIGPGPPLPSASSASVAEDGTAGAATTITVRLEDAFGTPVEGAAGDIAISITGANPASGVDVTDQGDGSYSASYTPIRTGTDQVDVRVRGTALADSPFSSTVVAGPADPATTTAAVSRVNVFFISVVVTTRDAQGNLVVTGEDVVQARLDGDSPERLDYSGNGTYSRSFFSFASSVAVILNGEPIAGSPFRPQ
jgi:hypothetical protein